jgi:hypothetical protein
MSKAPAEYQARHTAYSSLVIPAKAGIQFVHQISGFEAFAGMMADGWRPASLCQLKITAVL